MAAEREACPEPLLRAIARAFEAAVGGDPDPAARLRLGLGGLLYAAETYMPGERPEAAAALAEAIAKAAPLLAELSADGATVTDGRPWRGIPLHHVRPTNRVQQHLWFGVADRQRIAGLSEGGSVRGACGERGMDLFDGKWSEPHLIADKEHAPWFTACEDRPGVYRLIGLESNGDLTPALIARVCGTDDTGTVYIGAAKSLTGRIGRLVLQHLPPFKGGNHTAMSRIMAEKFPSTKLAVCWRFVDAPDDIFAIEGELLRSYKELFGELPPLNSQH